MEVKNEMGKRSKFKAEQADTYITRDNETNRVIVTIITSTGHPFGFSFLDEGWTEENFAVFQEMAQKQSAVGIQFTPMD